MTDLNPPNPPATPWYGQVAFWVVVIPLFFTSLTSCVLAIRNSFRIDATQATAEVAKEKTDKTEVIAKQAKAIATTQRADYTGDPGDRHIANEANMAVQMLPPPSPSK